MYKRRRDLVPPYIDCCFVMWDVLLEFIHVKDVELAWGKYMSQTHGKKVIRLPCGPLCSRCEETRQWAYEGMDQAEVAEKAIQNELDFKINYKKASVLREQVQKTVAKEIQSLRTSESCGAVLEKRRYFLSNAEFMKDFQGYRPSTFNFTATRVKVNECGLMETGVSFPWDAKHPQYRTLKTYGKCELLFDEYKVHAAQCVRTHQAEDLYSAVRTKTAASREAPLARWSNECISLEEMDKLAKQKKKEDEQEQVRLSSLSESKEGGGEKKENGEDAVFNSSNESSSEEDEDLEDLVIDPNAFKSEEQPDYATSGGRKGKGRGRGRAKAKFAAKAPGVQPKLLFQVGGSASSVVQSSAPAESQADATEEAGAVSLSSSKKPAPGSVEKLLANYDSYMIELTLENAVEGVNNIKAWMYQASRTVTAMGAHDSLAEKKILLTERMVPSQFHAEVI
jgi:hypothetical protein